MTQDRIRDEREMNHNESISLHSFSSFMKQKQETRDWANEKLWQSQEKDKIREEE